MINTEWLEKCAQAGEFLYGIIPVEVLKKMYRTREKDDPSIEEMVHVVEGSSSLLLDYMDSYEEVFESMGYKEPGYFIPHVPEDGEDDMLEVFRKAEKDGNPYARIHLDEDEWLYLFDEQMNVEFYLPTSAEIEQLISNGYIHDPHMDAYVGLLEKAGKAEELPSMWQRISSGELDGTDALGRLTELICSGAESIDKLNSLLPYVNDFYNHVNRRDRRGWAPSKLAEKMGGLRMPKTIVPGSTQAAGNLAKLKPFFEQNGISLDLSAMGQYTEYGSRGESRKVKVYPNDPCPCGSGIKYKKCHGRTGGIDEVYKMTVKL